MLQHIMLIVTYFKAVIHLSASCKTNLCKINLYFLKHCQIVGNLSLYASTSFMMTHRWGVVTRDRDKKSQYKLNYDSHQPLVYQIAKIERCVKYASIATCENALIYSFRSYNDIFYGVIYLELHNDALMARCEKQS